MVWSPNPAQLHLASGDGGCLSRSPRCPTRHTQGACPVLLLRLQRLAHSLLVSPRQVHLSSPQPCQFISRCCPVPRGRRGRETSGPNCRWLAEPCPHLLFLRQACCSGACQRAGRNGEDVLCSRGIGVSPMALTSAGWDGERGPTSGAEGLELCTTKPRFGVPQGEDTGCLPVILRHGERALTS